jgi:hypothetical protein
MKKMILSGIFAMIMAFSLFAQTTERKPMSSADRAKTTIERMSGMVTFTDKQKAGVIDIYTSFYDDVRAQQAFRDPSKLEPLEKARDAKVEKLLKDPKLYKKYSDAAMKLKTDMQEHQRKQGMH